MRSTAGRGAEATGLVVFPALTAADVFWVVLPLVLLLAVPLTVVFVADLLVFPPLQLALAFFPLACLTSTVLAGCR